MLSVCRHGECRYAEFRYAGCCGAISPPSLQTLGLAAMLGGL